MSTTKTDPRIKEFRSILKRAILMDKAETNLFDSVPDVLLERILVKNFNDNMALAERVLLNKYHEIDRVDRPLIEQKKKNIRGLDKSSRKIVDALQAGKKILFLTDNDNDGSMAQAAFLEFFRAVPEDLRYNISRAYAQPIGTSRGLNKENIDLIFDSLGWSEEEVLVVTADIGINNRIEQDKILSAYPKVDLIVTDHHLPVPEHVVVENEKTLIFNPKFQPTDYFKKKNISGANTLSVLLKDVLEKWKQTDKTFNPTDIDRVLQNMDEISLWSNLLDYVEADVVDMPLRPYIIKKALDLRSLLNVSNSMGTLVTLDWSEKDWIALKQQAPELNVSAIQDAVTKVKGLNRYSRRLLSFATQYGETADMTYSEKDFYILLSEVLEEDILDYHNINPNFIAQLRPHIFRLSAVDNKYAFLDLMKDEMVRVYEELRSVEKELVNELRKVDMLDGVRQEHSSIVFPKAPHLTKIFGRKLLNKIYNEENNGFYIILDKNEAGELSGSMRSLYDAEQVLHDKEDIEKSLGVKIEILGHSKAAGFKIIAHPGTVLDKNLLEKLNGEISQRIAQLKEQEKSLSLPFLDIDFASVGLVQKINTAVKGHLSNMNSLPCVLQLGKNGKNGVWVTDPHTTAQVSLAELVKTKKYGYQAIQTDFDGNAFVIPVEQIRKVVNNKFNSVVKMSYMDDGVFIAHQVSDTKDFKNLTKFHGDRSDQRDLVGYYFEAYRDSKFIPLVREDFLNLPYFKYNSYGLSEFEHLEQFYISLLDKTGQDVLAVIDTEGTGLGQAPKCFNIGGTNIKIKEGSGFVLTDEDFESRMYRDKNGQAYILSEEQKKSLISKDEFESTILQQGQSTGKEWFVYKGTATGGSDHNQEFVMVNKPEKLNRLTNFSKKGGQVYCNRTIEGFAFSYLVRDDDFAITPEFENLTGISHDMVQKFGTDSSEVDQELTDFYSQLKNAQGKPAKIIFSAHNLPYDKGVISSNFAQFDELMNEHVLCDTAKIARQAKLAYDDTPVASFEGVIGVPAKVYFYDSPYSSYSLSTFLQRVSKNKGGVYPDTSGRYLLRFDEKKGELSFIDKKEINEILLDQTWESLDKKKKVGSMPNNAVKYSVERLSTRAMIRNIILHDYQKPSLVELSDAEKKHEAALITFQEQYHFDNTLEDNIHFFLTSLHNSSDISLDTLLSIGSRFLSLNADVQAKFHDGWIYEKVLSYYEPASNEGKIAQDTINQINYYTDIPRKKIEKVFKDTISFKKKFGLAHALVHEQHNNIRQRSDDGQGLSDTAYESVLPNLLSIMKFYNPYTHSSQQAVSEVIEANLRGSMVQLFVKKDHQDGSAIDSFSMKQMQSFDRENKTALVEKAQQWWSSGGWDGQKTPIKFKLDSDTLPPGSAVYGVPKRQLSHEEIVDSSEKLNFILINEQLRTAATLSRSIGVDYAERLKAFAVFNDAKAMEYRNIILDRFDRVDFSRREATVKKLSEMMSDAFKGNVPDITVSLVEEMRNNPDILVTAAALQATHHTIDRRLGKPAFLSPKTAENVSDFLEKITNWVEGDDDIVIEGKKKNTPSTKKKKKAGNDDFDGSLVRNEIFLPNLDIRRDEPLKFILRQIGPSFFGHMLEKLDETQNISAPQKIKM